MILSPIITWDTQRFSKGALRDTFFVYILLVGQCVPERNIKTWRRAIFCSCWSKSVVKTGRGAVGGGRRNDLLSFGRLTLCAPSALDCSLRPSANLLTFRVDFEATDSAYAHAK